jgi:nitrite reductase/ring-hydroxylating ferredoxin subunit
MPILKQRRATEPTGGFIHAAQGEAVAEDLMTVVKIGGRKIILTRHHGRPYAFDATCPHAAADLSRGALRGWQVCCHEHDYCFDVRSGRIVWPEDEVYRLRRYETKEEGGAILIRLAPPLQAR